MTSARTIVSVGRSPMRIAGYALLAAPMLLLAIDMAFSHRFFPAPDTTEAAVGTTIDEAGSTITLYEDVLTNDGRAQRRRDLLWSAAFAGAGVLALGFSLREILLPRPVLVADQRGVQIRIFGGRRSPVVLAWDEIADVRSGILETPSGPVPVLSIMPEDPALLPARPAGAVTEPPWLHLLADDWDRQPHQLVPLIEPWLRRSRSVEIVEGPP
jgi:hypothetical protein